MNLQKGLPRSPKPGELCGLDVELYGMDENKLHRPTGTFACLSIAYENGDTYQVYDLPDLRKAMKIVDKGKWVFHNALFDIAHLRRFTTFKQRPIWDTMLVEQNLFGGYYDTFSMKDLSRRWLSEPMEKDTVKLFITGREMTPEMEQYAGTDALAAVRCAKTQQEYIKEHDREMVSYLDIDEPALWAVLDLPPVKIDVGGWLALAEENEQLAREAEDGLGFNPRSPKQAKTALEKVLRTSIKNTAEATLQVALERAVERGNKRAIGLLEKLLDARMYDKASRTYGKAWIEQHVEDGDLVYCNYLVTQAETGRMAARSPNLMNIPARRMPRFRNMFISSYAKGKMLVVDVSQQETRVLAYMSRDEELIKALAGREDIHLSVAKDIYEDPTITKDDPRRFDGKTINLGTSYGLTAKGLAAKIKVSEEDAQRFLNRYFARFRGVADWTYRQRAMAQRLGYIETPIGRRAWVNPYNYRWQNNAVNCVDENTEALTTRGWIRGPDLLQNDVLLTKNPTSNKLEWQSLTNIKRYPDYEGSIVEFRSRSFHAISTPNHRWLVYGKSKRGNQIKTTTELGIWGDYRIHRTGNYSPPVGVSSLSPDEAELLGWFVTDGYIRPTGKGNGKRGPKTKAGGKRAHLCQSIQGNPDKCHRIDTLLKRLGPIDVRRGAKIKTLSREGTYATWNLGARLTTLLLDHAPDRTLSVPTLLRLDHRALVRLREAMLLGDGTRDRYGRWKLSTGRKEQADAFQILCTLTGDHASVVWRDMHTYIPISNKMRNIPKTSGVWIVSILKRKHVQVTENQTTRYERPQPMWCPTIPNGFFVARKDGHVFVTGNSPIQGGAADLTKYALSVIHRETKTLGLPYGVCLLVHDELVADLPPGTIRQYKEVQKAAWNEAGRKIIPGIPMEVEMYVGTNWGAKH